MTRDAETEHRDTRWMARANCIGLDPALFFPERGASVKEAKAVCAGCEVKAECLKDALDRREKHGIFGGTSERERRRLRKARADAARVADPVPPRTPGVCAVPGCDRAGRRGDTLCQAHRMRKWRTGDVQADVPLRHRGGGAA